MEAEANDFKISKSFFWEIGLLTSQNNAVRTGLAAEILLLAHSSVRTPLPLARGGRGLLSAHLTGEVGLKDKWSILRNRLWLGGNARGIKHSACWKALIWICHFYFSSLEADVWPLQGCPECLQLLKMEAVCRYRGDQHGCRRAFPPHHLAPSGGSALWWPQRAKGTSLPRGGGARRPLSVCLFPPLAFTSPLAFTPVVVFVSLPQR